MEHPKMTREAKRKLRAVHDALNPKLLHDEILRLRKKLFKNARFTRSDV
jgi:hypothetical protein